MDCYGSVSFTRRLGRLLDKSENLSGGFRSAVIRPCRVVKMQNVPLGAVVVVDQLIITLLSE
jgi:hypothetical protein